AALIMQQARQRGYAGRFVGSDSDPSIVQKSGGAAVGYVTGLTFNPSDSRPWVQDLFDRYRKKYGSEPASRSINSYDAVMLIADAAARANSTTDRQAIRNALGSTRGFQGVATKYTYEGSGDNKTQAVYLHELDASGKYVPLK